MYGHTSWRVSVTNAILAVYRVGVYYVAALGPLRPFIVANVASWKKTYVKP